MKTKIQIIEKLGILPQDRTLVLWSMIHAFGTSGLVIILGSIPLALFLSKFNSASLAYAVVGNAFICLLLGFLYTYLEKRVTFSKMQRSLLIAIIASILLSWVCVSATSSGWVIAGVLIVSFTVIDFAIFEFWCVLSQVYSLQQAKRLFGLINVIYGFSGILIGLISPILILFMGAKNLLLIASGLAFISLISLGKLRKEFPQKLDFKYKEDDVGSTDDKISEKANLNFKTALKNKYFMSIFLLCSVATITYSLLYVLFNSIVESHFHDENSLGSFFSIFNTFVSFSNLAMSACLPFIMKRFGVLMALILNPIISITLTSIAYIWIWISPGNIFDSISILCLFLFYSIYSASVSSPGLLVLLQPLTYFERPWVQSKIDTLVLPLSTFIVGTLIIFINHVSGISSVVFLPIIMICFIVYFIITLQLKNGYISHLNLAIKKPYLFKSNFENLDKSLLPRLKSKINSPYPEEIFFSLTNLEKLDTLEYLRALKKSIKNTNKDIRANVVERASHYQDNNLLKKIQLLATQDESATVRALCYKALASSHNKSDIDFVLSGLDSPNPLVVYQAIAGVFNKLPQYQSLVIDILLRMLNSQNPEEQLLAVRSIGDNKIDALAGDVFKMICANNSTVTKEAIISLGKLNHIEHTIALLHQQTILLKYNTAVLQTVIQSQLTSDATFTHQFSELSSEAQCLIAKACGLQKSNPNAIALLSTYIDTPDLTIRHSVLTALMKLKYIPTESYKNRVDNLINTEADSLKILQGKINMIPEETAAECLKGFLERLIFLNKQRLLAALSFKYDWQTMINIKSSLESNNDEIKSYGLELFEVVLTKEHKPVLLPLFQSTQKANKTTKNEATFNDLLTEILENDNKQYHPWIIASAIYYIGNNQLKHFMSQIQSYLVSPHKVLTETSEWTVAALDI